MTDLGSIDGPARATVPENAGPDVRVSTLLGSRVCTKCGFDLCGQPVMREAKYGMLMVRCPECGMVAALLEYPAEDALARQVDGVSDGAVAAGVAARGPYQRRDLKTRGGRPPLAACRIPRICRRDCYGVRHPYEVPAADDARLALLHRAWQPGSVPTADSWVDTVWWEGVADKTLAQQGGRWRAIRWPSLVTVIYELPVTIAIGVLWSVAAALHVKRCRRLLLLRAGAHRPGALCWRMLDFGRMAECSLAPTARRTSLPSNRRAFPLRLSAMVVLMGEELWLGMWIGRPLARLAVRTFLHPRLWGSLSLLWIEEGSGPSLWPESSSSGLKGK